MQKAVKRYMPIFVLPTFCAFILGFIIPFIMGIWLSFCKFTTVTDAKFVGFSNYKKAFEDTVFRHSFWYTALFAVASLIIINAVAFALASALTKNMRGTNIFRTIFFMPNLIGGIVLGYIWQLIFNGILEKYGTALALNEWYGFWGLIILVSWQQIGYMMIIYIAGLQSIPGDVMEAAQIDGASKVQQFWYITVPHIKVVVGLLVVLRTIWVFNNFDIIYLLAGGGPANATTTMPIYAYNMGWNTKLLGRSSAVTMLLLAFLLLVCVIYFTIIGKWEKEDK